MQLNPFSASQGGVEVRQDQVAFREASCSVHQIAVYHRFRFVVAVLIQPILQLTMSLDESGAVTSAAMLRTARKLMDGEIFA